MQQKHDAEIQKVNGTVCDISRAAINEWFNQLTCHILPKGYFTPKNYFIIYTPLCNPRCIWLAFYRWTQTQIYGQVTGTLMMHRLTAHSFQVRFCKHHRGPSHLLKWYCFSDTGFIITQARAGLTIRHVIYSSWNITISMCCVSISSVTSTFIVCFIQSQWHHTSNCASIKSIKWPRSTDVCVSPPPL